jgi:hypothetical protein
MRTPGDHSALSSPFAALLGRAASAETADISSLAEGIQDKRQTRPFLGAWLERLSQIPIGRPWTLGDDSGFAATDPKLWLSHHGHLDVTPKAQDFHLALVTSEIGLEEALCHLAFLGFDGACCPVAQADQAEIQYLTELGRELRFSPIWMIESERDLKTVLGTDAPYFGFVASGIRRKLGRAMTSFPYSPSDWTKLCRMLPDTVRALCFFEVPDSDADSFMYRLADGGFHAFVDVTT